jgi:hypothetical protein
MSAAVARTTLAGMAAAIDHELPAFDLQVILLKL